MLETALIPVTNRAGWEGKPFFVLLAERVTLLERMLVAQGFPDPIPRLAAHLGTIERQLAKPGIDSDETLWSIVESQELGDIYCTLPMLPRKMLREKFGAIFQNPANPRDESPESSLSRNTLFELYFAGWLCKRGVPTSLAHKPDIACSIGDWRVLIQCKRPFSFRSVAKNIKLARKQLSRDLNESNCSKSRGVVAVCLSRALNPGTQYLRVANETQV